MHISGVYLSVLLWLSCLASSGCWGRLQGQRDGVMHIPSYLGLAPRR